MKTHAPHPTQHAACGAPSFVTVEYTDMAKVDCKRCLKVLAALDAGRPVYRGLEPAALEPKE
jgi:hypothetical protein